VVLSETLSVTLKESPAFTVLALTEALQVYVPATDLLYVFVNFVSGPSYQLLAIGLSGK